MVAVMSQKFWRQLQLPLHSKNAFHKKNSCSAPGYLVFEKNVSLKSQFSSKWRRTGRSLFHFVENTSVPLQSSIDSKFHKIQEHAFDLDFRENRDFSNHHYKFES